MSGSFVTKREKHPRRPLQGTAGVAGTVIDPYRFVKNRKVWKKRTERGDLVQDQTLSPVLAQTPTQRFRAPELEDRVRELERLLCKANRECKQRRQSYRILQAENNQMQKIFQQKEMVLKESLADAELKHQKAISQLEAEKSELTDSVKTLQSTVQDLEDQLCDSQHESDKLQFMYDQQKVAHNALLELYETVKKELKESLADAELKHQKALDSISQLEAEKSELTVSVKNLRSRVRDLAEELCDTHLQSDEEIEQQQEAHDALMELYETMKKKMKESLADAELKHQKALESISQLEAEKSELTDSVKTLRSTVQDLKDQLCDSQHESDELQFMYDQQKVAHNALLELYETVKESLADAELKHQKALDSISQLEAEKSELTVSVKNLRSRVQDLAEELCDTHLQRDEDIDQQQEAHDALLELYEKMKKELKESLADAELKHQKALESIIQLEAEKSELTDSVKSLRSRVQDLEDQLCDSHLVGVFGRC